MGKKTNPRNIPRSQADVDKAYERGYADAEKKWQTSSLILVLYTLLDKFGANDEELKQFSDAFNYVLDSLNRGYIKDSDLQAVIKEEYGTEIVERD